MKHHAPDLSLNRAKEVNLARTRWLGTAALRVAAFLALTLALANSFAAEQSIHLTYAGRDANGAFTLELSGPAPGVYRLEVSDDLAHWQPLATNVLTGQTLVFADARPAAPRRFYRAVLTGDPPYAPGQVLLRFKAEANVAAMETVFDALQMNVIEEILTPAMEATGCPGILCMHTAKSVPEAVAALNAHPAIEFAEPNYILTHAAASNDPKFTDGSLWGMYGDASAPANPFGSQAAEAWTQGYTGSRQVYVGVIDEGIQFEHPDLAANVWTNPFEIPGNGIDDDGNGFVDDMHGWDFFSTDNSVFDGSPGSPSVDAHGTHVAGTIGGVGGNGLGVAGVNWQVTMISGKFLGPGGGYTSDALKAVDYFTDLKRRHGLNIVALNNSWVGGGYSRGLHESIIRAAKVNILFVAAAGNSPNNNDATASYPSGYDTTQSTPGESAAGYDAVVAVAALASNGSMAAFSSYGVRTVDLGAPGVGVWSSVPWLTYASYSGTSMATPHVTGAAALYASTHPGASAAQIKTALLGSTISTPSLAGRCVTGGRLNLSTVIQPPLPPVNPPAAPSTLDATFSADFNVVFLSWRDNSTDETGFRIERSYDGVTYTSLAILTANATFFEDNTFIWNAHYYYRVRAFRGNAESAPSNVEEVITPSAPRIIYVDATFTGDRPNGSPLRPFPTVTQGHAAARAGDTLRIRANMYRERPLVTKQVKLESLGGAVVIGP